jgi:hypothetical protein
MKAPKAALIDVVGKIEIAGIFKRNVVCSAERPQRVD